MSGLVGSGLPSNVVTLHGLCSKSHIITLTNKGVRYKLFRIDFQPDGSIFVNFPYYRNSVGIASVVHFPPSGTGAYDSLSITDDARITSHLVKYAHHATGEAHFSMDGRVQTQIRKQSVPLTKLKGHLFSIYIQGFAGFEEARGKKYDHGWTEKRSTAHFDLQGEVGAVRFVATWQHYTNLIKNAVAAPGQKKVGPQIIFNDPKDRGVGFVLGPDQSNPFNEFILFLRIHIMGPLDPSRESVLGFIGGFDPLGQVNNLSGESTMLSLVYPVGDPEVFKATLQSMDFIRPDQTA